MKQKKIFALGFFDGVHLGHQALLHACHQLAIQQGAVPCAVTFDMLPGAVLLNAQSNMLNTAQDRRMLLHQFGMEEVLLLKADQQTLSMSWTAFLEMLIADGAVGFVCGYDFRFGHKGEGTAEKLSAFAQEQGLACIIVPEQTMDGEKISSTRIRELLEQGDVERATTLLRHPHILSGTVVSGQKLGRTIGIPTANLELPEELVKPAFGVYACKAWVDGNYYTAVTNIGTRPTVDGQGVTIEPWILDFDGDLYGKEITLEFHKFLRPEQKFADLDELKAQIQTDAAETRKFFA
jgi:riboflavin kinase/FMN adenylyltransferase